MESNNLIPLSERSEEDRHRIASMGGKACAKVKQRKKFLSQLYAEMLEDDFDVQIDEDVKKKFTSEKFFKYVSQKVLERGDAASVAMLKEIADRTEKQLPPNTDEVDTIVFDRQKKAVEDDKSLDKKIE